MSDAAANQEDNLMRRVLRSMTLAWRELTAVRRTRGSVRGKLMGVVSSTTVIALLVAGAALLWHDLSDYRRSWTSDLATEASILSMSLAPALAFDDQAAAERNLVALQARPQLLVAALYLPSGELYCDYVRPGSPPPPPRLTGAGVGTNGSAHTVGARVELTAQIVRNGEWLGTILLQARYDVVGRVVTYLGILAIVIAFSLFAALILSTALQRVITAPLDAMSDVARQIVHQRDYSLRVQKTTDDEIGLVVDAFNSMLDEVHIRTQALEQSNVALQAEVKVRQAAEAALGRASARLESAMAAAEIGSWVWDPQSGEATVDRNLAALYGFADERQLNEDALLQRQLIHADDLAAVSAAEEQALRSGVLPSTEFRIMQPDGSIRWVARRGKVHFDAARRPVLLAGVLIDVTAQKLAEQALSKSEKLYRAIGESIDYGIWVCDAQGRNTYASEQFLRLLGLTQEQCSGTGWMQVLHPDDLAATAESWRECVRSGGNWYRDHRMRGADGEYHAVLAKGVAIRDDNGKIAGWAGINLDISRLKHTENALREADRRKDEFLATLAHELRNPLAPIRNAAKLLESPAADERQLQWGRDVISRQVQRMALLLDDLLDVSRITSGRLQLRKEPVDLAALVASAVETARPLIDAKRHSIDIVLPPEAVQLVVDPLRLSQALSNLLTNAAKYTDPAGHIRLVASLAQGSLALSVSDSGIGLAADAMPKLFEMFSQLDSAVDRAEGGLGIGLALVKGLVALHGGTVEATSEGPGRGSTFTINLPRTGLVAPKRQPYAGPAPCHPHTGPRCKVLVADDNGDAAQTLALILKMSGYDVHLATSGGEALQLARRERPDAMFLDIGMPDMSGYEVAGKVRQEQWGESALLVAVTGWGQPNDKEMARAAGFNHHLTKPVDLEQVAQLLAAYSRQMEARYPNQDGAPDGAPGSARDPSPATG
jgi:PAS domain S-box-containing protein